MRRAALTALFLALCLLTACSNEPGFVERTWALNIRELGVAPTFPPREDFQVGDVYLPAVSPEKENEILKSNDSIPIGTWLGRVSEAKTLASRFYEKERSDFPKSTSAIGQALASDNGIPPLVAQPEARQDAFTQTNAKRLRLVGFPEFLSASYTGVDAAALVDKI